MLARRFAPPAAAFFLVALPAARAPRIFRRLVPAAVFLAMIAVTTQSWVGFERDETAGLEECVAAVPEGSRLLALDYVRTSAYFWIGPFMHIGAYAAVERGAWLAIDFADLPTSLVVRDPPPPERRFTPALEIQPRHLKPRDLDLCDYVLVVGETFDYAQFEPRFPRLEVVKSSGRFRLYRVRPAVST